MGEKLDIYTIISQLIGSHKIIQTRYSKDVSTLNEGTSPLVSSQYLKYSSRILIQLEMDKELPTECDFSVVGGIEKLKFL